ncbi:ABC transporter ATP-binding protein [Sneathiella sp.]|uniref:ABC transporter ATP-binding protein n=1 Tax=Sneathiella sp. TaxID=1964365 RepID=UPI0035679E55
MTQLKVQGISHAFDILEVLNDVSFTVEAGELTCLVGPSGCGKSTLLRLIAGLEQTQSGSITLEGEVLSAPAHSVPTRLRRIGLVFQQPSLFPHLTVCENIAFGLHGQPKDRVAAAVEELLAVIGLAERSKAYPHQLSGGQQQRVALARALAPKPRLMLLDEPFANLDHALRCDMREEVLGMLKQTGIPVVMVTHEPEEALIMADKMVLLRADGRVHQYASPQEIYRAPVDAEAAAFFGVINRIGGYVEEGQVVSPLGIWSQSACGVEMTDGSKVDIIVRPESLRLANDADIAATVNEVWATAVGWMTAAKLSGGISVRFMIPYAQGIKPAFGDHVNLHCDGAHIFPA